MSKETIFIKNRNGFKMSVRITKPNHANRVVFLEHGFSGCKDEKHMLIMEEEFAQAGYIVINFDAIDSINESETSPIGTTFTAHYTDLEDIIEWASKQSWYKEPFALAGHSMGAASVLLYAKNFPNKVDLLLPISFPWLSGDSKNIQDDPVKMKNWKTTGYWDKISQSRGRTLRVPYNFIEDLSKYDFAENASRITARTILIIGDLEKPKRLDDNQKLLDILTCEKDLIILPNTPHCTATTQDNADTFRKYIKRYINSARH